jgi:hypothetical protein
VVACPCGSFSAEAALVLKNVMADLMRKNMAQHEPPQRIGWPRDDTGLAQIRTGRLQLFSVVLRGCVRKPPRRQRLVVQAYMTGPDEFAE